MEATVYMEKDIYYDIEEVLTMLSRKNRTKRPPSFLWSRVSDHVHRQILYMVAQELNLPNPRFIASKIWKNTALNL